MKTKLSYLFLIGLIGFSACEKEKNVDKQSPDRSTLVELAEGQAEKTDNFLLNGNKIDNTSIYERFVLHNQDRSIIWRPFPSGWGWGCVGCFGLCNVDNPFPFPFPGDPVPFPFPWETIEHSSVGGVIDAGREGQKFQLYPKPRELACAITEDGFFPIQNDIPMSDMMCEILELPMGTYIEAGIYSANIGDSGEYNSVTLNLAH